MNARHWQGVGFFLLGAVLLGVSLHQGFRVLMWSGTGAFVLVLWVSAGLTLGWLGRPTLLSSSIVLAVAAAVSGVRHLPAISQAMGAQWHGTLASQMIWGSAFVCLGCALARAAHRTPHRRLAVG